MADYKFSINTNEYLPLRDVVFNTLRDAILTGKLQPGERLMENQLAEKLGVSRTPIREALRMLEIENLVKLVPRKGAQVLDMTEKDIINVLELRGALESLGVKLACKNMSEEDIEKLKLAEADVESALAGDDVEKMAEADQNFHDIIFNSTGNDKLIQIISNLDIQLYRYRLAHLRIKGQNQSIIKEQHTKIINAIENRLPKEGSEAANEHIKYHTEYTLSLLNRE
ncbi:MAG: GntR family transcriptional regulator [Tyzzerella sp.]|uniref:GntR family transcriptional regulator n=1 Tax=Candidatus Fimicola merdigallinarum TaxID=2840819 RepID=A0A9D9DVL1_9FIRM|nr:GntR family transcriptional regulator [Candidatus Fimicola merdigallinarum]